jgi:5-methylcytosine-specific restriction endonuclease McrA
MVHGQHIYTTKIQQEAINRGYQFKDKNGNNDIIKIGNNYFHPHYVSLDHKTTKARCPELMFDYANLQIMCIRCNRRKGDDNTFDSNMLFEIVSDLAKESLNRYKPLP